ncbi:hypothetical protein NBT05_06395 [Aquimarina sp. ERC-38]|uniref:hypothetical protein n=1 Tax=Aquimarina sp. ERC-38 TaxID=2949996 RepID=UPI0022464D85|nr:hypothetical protein [Aquimarina sp. ERC-38]UZO82098.1 hypothetical protein NBT05_06395 [Aquimarina sp. ERC-38]
MESNKKKRINTKIGDVFCAEIDKKSKRFFQLIAYDKIQLNSDVIRVFTKIYSVNQEPDLSEIISDNVEFYVHCATKIGLKLDLWKKVGNISNIGSIDKILFRSTNDYGTKHGGVPLKVSHNWHVWRINDRDFTKVGKLTDEYKKSFIGLVVNPLGIMKMLKGEKYPINYPDF